MGVNIGEFSGQNVRIIGADVLGSYGVRALGNKGIAIIPGSAIIALEQHNQGGAREIVELIESNRTLLDDRLVSLDGVKLAVFGYTKIGSCERSSDQLSAGLTEVGKAIKQYCAVRGIQPHIFVVSNSLSERLRAVSAGLGATSYQAASEPFSGQVTVSIDTTLAYGEVPSPEASQTIVRQALATVRQQHGLVPAHLLVNVQALNRKTMPYIYSASDEPILKPVYGKSSSNSLQAVAKTKNAEQETALDYLMDDHIQMVGLSGAAGAGKTYLSLAAGLAGMKSGRYEHILCFRPMYNVGGQEMGTLPGDKSDKFAPWTAAIKDNLEALHVTERTMKKIFIDPLTYIRGRTLANMLVIVDDAQSLDKWLVRDIMTRVGSESKIVFTYDLTQMDRIVSREDSVQAVLDECINDPCVAALTLSKTQRSHLADLAIKSLARDKFNGSRF